MLSSSPFITFFLIPLFILAAIGIHVGSLQCQLDVRDLWDEDKYPMVFYDMCILYGSIVTAKMLS